MTTETKDPFAKLADPESELWLLQTMLLLAESCDQAAVMVTADDFSDPRNAIIYRHLSRLHEQGKSTDAGLLFKSLQDSKDFDRIGGAAYLSKLIEDTVTPYHARYYAERVRKASVLRQLQKAGREISEGVSAASLEDDVEELVGRCEQSLFDVTENTIGQRQTQASLREVVYAALDKIDARKHAGSGDGLRTGIFELDKMTGGLRSGELIVIGARPGCGKSALALSIAQNMAVDGEAAVVFCSLEMSAGELAERMLGSVSKVSLHSLRNGGVTADQRQALIETAGRLAGSMLFIDDAPSRTVAQIASFARMVKRRNKRLDCLIVDYIQLITPESGRDPRQEQVAKISRKLKTLARELKIPIICLAQLNRNADDPGKAPRLSQLRESGAIEQDADMVVFIHRPEATKPDSDVKDSEEAELHVAKQRNGPTGVVKVGWYRRYCRFDQVPEKWQERKDTAFDDWNK